MINSAQNSLCLALNTHAAKVASEAIMKSRALMANMPILQAWAVGIEEVFSDVLRLAGVGQSVSGPWLSGLMRPQPMTGVGFDSKERRKVWMV